MYLLIHSFTYPFTNIYPYSHPPTHLPMYYPFTHAFSHQNSPSAYAIHMLGLQHNYESDQNEPLKLDSNRFPNRCPGRGGDSMCHGVSRSHFSRTTLLPSGLQVRVNQRPLHCQAEGFQPPCSNITGKIYVTTHKHKLRVIYSTI